MKCDEVYCFLFMSTLKNIYMSYCIAHPERMQQKCNNIIKRKHNTQYIYHLFKAIN